MKPPNPESSPVPGERDPDTAWIDHQVATRLFGTPLRKIGRYTILETLGSGGMGLVYRAHDPQLDRPIAIKLLNADWSTPEGAWRMHREARAMARLSHPNVVQIYEVGQHRERVFLAMEYVEGMTLAAWLDRAQSSEQVHAMFLAIGAGVAAAHAVGIVHRDLKPTNILVDTSGRPRVADFGLAFTGVRLDHERAVTEPETSRLTSVRTTVSQVVGTPRYMAPEQFEGLPADARSDQFSFCAMMWEALCGHLPFREPRGDQAQSRDWTLQDPPRAARLAPRVRNALARGLARSPRHRWPSMAELLVHLGGRTWLRRNSWPIVALCLVTATYGITPSAPAGLDLGPCGPGAEVIEDYSQRQLQQWRDELTKKSHPQNLHYYLDAMLSSWEEEVDSLCDAHSTDDARLRKQLLRRGACIRERAEFLSTWILDDQPLPPSPSLGPGSLSYNLSLPSRWLVEPLDQSCLYTDEEAYDALFVGGTMSKPTLTRDLAKARVYVDVGYPTEALELLKTIEPALRKHRLPADFHLIRAQALEALHSATDVVRRHIYAAEDAAELQADDQGRFDAHLSLVHLSLSDHRYRQLHSQTSPSPLQDDRLDRTLDSAEMLLQRQPDGQGSDAMLRLYMARVELADAQEDPQHAKLFLDQALSLAEKIQSPKLTLVLSEYAAHSSEPAASTYYQRAVELARGDDEMTGYLHHAAASRAYTRGDYALSKEYTITAERFYTRALGPETSNLALLAYNKSLALYTSGEASAALPYAIDAVAAHQRLGQALQLAAALYLKSSILLRTGDLEASVRDAKAALLAFKMEPPTTDTNFWRTVFQTGLVESQAAAGHASEALVLADEVERALAATPGLDGAGQRGELALARSRALATLGRSQDARKELETALTTRLFAANEFKHAEALALYGALRGRSATSARKKAAVLFSRFGSDGAARMNHRHSASD